MLTHVALYLPGTAGLGALAAVLAIAAAFLGLGRLFDDGHQPAENWLVSGWAATVIAATVFGVATPLSLVWVLYPAVFVGALGWIRLWRSNPEDRVGCARLLAIGLPVLLVVSAASASQWDEFAHWLVNQRYLVDVGTFPRRGLPESPTIFAAYPYGLPMIGFLASRLTGAFVENAGALINTALILVLAAAVVRAFRTTAGMAIRPLSWSACAVGFLAATLLNPTFVPKLVFTTYADWTTAVVLGIAVVTGWRLVESAAGGEPAADLRNTSLHLGLAVALLLNLKQPNLILAVLLLAGIGVSLAAAWRRPIGQLLPLVLRAAAPAAVIYLTWRYHVAQNLAGREFSFLPLSSWLWADLGAVFGRMVLIASKKGGYFGVMLIATSVAVWSAVEALRKRPLAPLGRLAIIVAVLFVGYNAFLYVAYVGAFGAGEGRSAASYWRYNTQLGGAALAFAAASVGALYRRYQQRLPAEPRLAATLVIGLAVLVPLALAPKIRFDLNPVTRYVRTVGIEMSELLPRRTKLVVIDPADNGKRALLLRYETSRVASVERFETDVSDPAVVRRALDGLRSAYVWVHVPTPALAQAFEIDLAARTSHLLQAKDDGWKIVRSWPYPGYTDPVAEDD